MAVDEQLEVLKDIRKALRDIRELLDMRIQTTTDKISGKTKISTSMD